MVGTVACLGSGPEGSRRRAVYPGSFDPLHAGHLDLLRRARVLFSDVTVLVACNPAKVSAGQLEQRVQRVRDQLAADWDDVQVDSWSGLTVEYCLAHRIGVIVRGVRNRTDMLYETQLAAMNRSLPGVETLLLPTNPGLASTSSSLIRQSLRPGAEERSERGSPSRLS